jgi:hypothetical protein
MMDHTRTVNTLGNSPDLETLREELNRACDEIEAQGSTGDELGIELVRLGTVVALAIAGPVPVLCGLASLQKQIANSFPDEWQTVKAQLSTKGNA